MYVLGYKTYKVRLGTEPKVNGCPTCKKEHAGWSTGAFAFEQIWAAMDLTNMDIGQSATL
jgi:hypothetical protein